LITVYKNAKQEGRVHTLWHPLLAMEEAGRTPVPLLYEQVATFAGRDMSIIAVFQSLSQIDAAFGKERAQILKDNMDTQIFHRPATLETAEYLMRWLGERTGFVHSHTTYRQEETSEGKQERVLPLLTIRELAELSDEKVLGFHADTKPFLINRMNWHIHPAFNHWHHLKPPPVPVLPKLSENILADKEQDMQEETAELGDPDEPEDRPELDKAKEKTHFRKRARYQQLYALTDR
jgi:type IV secretory pathway TraG/TraD family ATPase VirD4